MAIFASTTTSGYSDPLKAYSIKALEMRQQEMQAQQAKEQAAMFTPENTQTPIQGIAQVANVAADAFKQRRLDNVAAANRDRLTGLIAGTKPGEDFSPQAQAEMAILAPDFYKEFAASMAERRKQRDLFGQQDKARTEDARIAQEAAKAQEVRIQERPTDLPSVQARRAAARGEITKEEADAIIKKATDPSSAEKEHLVKRQLESADTQSSLNAIDRALELIDSPEGIHAGPQSGLKQSIGEKTPAMLQGISKYQPDPKTTENTQRYNQIMNTEVLAMLNAMKGSSSENELRFNYKIANDPDATVKVKREAVQFIRNKYAEHVKILNAAIAGSGGDVPKVERPGGGGAATPSAGGGGGAADPLAAAQDAINRGAPFESVAAIFKGKGGDPSQLKPKGP